MTTPKPLLKALGLVMHLESGTYRDGVWCGYGHEESDRHGWQSSGEAVAAWKARGVFGKPYLNGRETASGLRGSDGLEIMQRVWFGDAIDTPLFELGETL